MTRPIEQAHRLDGACPNCTTHVAADLGFCDAGLVYAFGCVRHDLGWHSEPCTLSDWEHGCPFNPYRKKHSDVSLFPESAPTPEELEQEKAQRECVEAAERGEREAVAAIDNAQPVENSFAINFEMLTKHLDEARWTEKTVVTYIARKDTFDIRAKTLREALRQMSDQQQKKFYDHIVDQVNRLRQKR